MNTHVEVAPFRVWVHHKYFYDMENVEAEPYVRCVVFAVSSYQGHEPTFVVRTLREGGIFHYIPVRALASIKKPTFDIAEGHLCYHNCPDFWISVNQYRYLCGKVMVTFVRPEQKVISGEYILTVDWPQANQNMHLIALDSGQFAWVPSHKVLFRNKTNAALPPYKKLRQQWIVD